MNKYVIIGGVAGGASVAARLRRMDEQARIILIEKGPYISYANCGLPYYIGETIPQREKLFVQSVPGFAQRFRVEIRTLSEAVAVLPKQKTVRIRETESGNTYEETYDKLVLSPGALPVVPDWPGVQSEGIFTLRDVQDTDRIKQYIQEKEVESAVIIGGGFIGLEMAENLCMAGLEVSLVEKQPQVMGSIDLEMANFIHQKLYDNGVALYLGKGVSRFEREADGLRVTLDNGERIDCGMALLCIGVRPHTELARAAGLRIGETGGIAVNAHMQTSDPDIYALGDAVEIPHRLLQKPVLLPLAGPANKEARIVADNMVLGNRHTYNGCIGTSIAKVFDLHVASVGLNEKLLQKEGLPYAVSHTHSASHATYYPQSKMIDLKLLFHPENGRLWGAQAVGSQGVDKRIEMIAQVLRLNGNVTDLCETEQAYAPPFASAKDPVNMAGFVADNILAGRCRVVQWQEVAHRNAEQSLLLDVRTPLEYAAGHLPDAMNMEVDHLREHLSELPKDKDIIIYCAIGLRGYLACRILSQHGFTRVYNLSGGFRTYQMAVKKF
ncbi:MAG: FAD-dependent oxidoreductase [Bacteroidales bacterium]|nr:FAD-dependent oxidoreductase [Bacteroidales bacterium]